ncbi:metal ABC transporter substrate-binding protein [Clostridium sp. MSJ-8]|uniref:MetQ/NlpA family ABC transporter substrate-binding protein n=1 Tax=Clostridium sp. MSJ-8 TaxID=2841510 RepID=UPI001C0F3483|nr:MetQ/NlpA family ABC transporter substrate-binding protein [Clostridium sp. MSJ-8]MBU5486927.1 metal ABC transporter substrate-binding protein [Clostridium sp. MSJ-8]
MKKLVKLIQLFLLTILSVSLIACQEGGEEKNNKTLKVGVCAGPYGDMFEEAIKPSLEKKGYKVEIVEFSDYVQPNNALADKEIDLNMFQHSTYLNNFKSEHGLDLTYITEIPTAGMAIFSDKYKNIDDIEEGETIAIPNDDTNLSRSLRVLKQAGIIDLDENIDPAKATIDDIKENPKKLKFTEVGAEVMVSVLDSVGAVVINGNYAISGGLNLSDALYNEEIQEGYFNVIAIRTEDEKSQFVKDIKEIVKSNEFKSVIEDKNSQYVSFSRPKNY